MGQEPIIFLRNCHGCLPSALYWLPHIHSAVCSSTYKYHYQGNPSLCVSPPFCALQLLWWLMLNFDSSAYRTASRYRVWTKFSPFSLPLIHYLPFKTCQRADLTDHFLCVLLYFSTRAIIVFFFMCLVESWSRQSYHLVFHFSVGRGNSHPNLKLTICHPPK